AEELYSDKILNNYMELENSIIEKINNDSITILDIEQIEKMKAEIEESNRSDIKSQLDMLKFIAETSISEETRTTDASQIIKQLSAEEKELRTRHKKERAGQIATEVSIGTAIVSGTIFAVSSIIYSTYYEQYTESQSSENAAFYLFWWQIMEEVSILSGVTTIISSATAGILSVLF
ncbi:MAG: hypothetical protein PQJ46_05710, partial [Spirochaetales bacterium]|nr:hypothetical protein [Spirochaetales bacterium]